MEKNCSNVIFNHVLYIYIYIYIGAKDNEK